MLDLLAQFIIFVLASLLLWWGTGLVVNAVTSLSRSLHISTFTLSFFVLGIMTSLPEIMIGITAVSRGESALMVGNLLGATLILFLLVIPLLALVGKGITLPKTLHHPQLILSLVTILAPALLIADRTLHIWEGLLLVALYLALFLILSRRESLYEKIVARLTSVTHKSEHRLYKLVGGVLVITVAAHYMVDAAEFFAATLSWSPFVVGLLIVALGTNIPELSLVLRTALSGKSEVALADYIGSAAANTLLIGVFTLLSGGGITLPNHALVRIIILLASLGLFYIFIRSQKKLTRREALVLLLIYGIFVMIEISQA